MEKFSSVSKSDDLDHKLIFFHFFLCFIIVRKLLVVPRRLRYGKYFLASKTERDLKVSHRICC